ncbi:MAG: hypothetical protein P1U77_10810 [Rubripirellula sp.]|nr:hypothetical protein [Rubripirellula sp.]
MHEQQGCRPLLLMFLMLVPDAVAVADSPLVMVKSCQEEKVSGTILGRVFLRSQVGQEASQREVIPMHLSK